MFDPSVSLHFLCMFAALWKQGIMVNVHPANSRLMQITENKYPNTDALSNMKAFRTFEVTMGSLHPTHKPLYDTQLLRNDQWLWAELCWMTLA